MSILDLEIRGQVDRYARGDIDLEEFRDWYDPVMWKAEEEASPEEQELVYEICGLLAEYDHGHWTEEELMNRLLELWAFEPDPISGDPRITSRTTSDALLLGGSRHDEADTRYVEVP